MGLFKHSKKLEKIYLQSFNTWAMIKVVSIYKTQGDTSKYVIERGKGYYQDLSKYIQSHQKYNVGKLDESIVNIKGLPIEVIKEPKTDKYKICYEQYVAEQEVVTCTKYLNKKDNLVYNMQQEIFNYVTKGYKIN